MKARALFVVAAVLGCERTATLPSPALEASPRLHATHHIRNEDPAAIGRVRAMAQACQRANISRARGAAARAMDEVRMTLGSLCALETVGGDALHWRVRCDASAFFDLGEYALKSTPEATMRCASLGNTVTDRWTCAGAVLRDFVSADGTLDLVTVGHVDRVALSATTRFDGCPTVRTSLGYNPATPWFTAATGTTPEARTRGNEQLAWCRAAQVARSVRCGMALRARGGIPASPTCEAMDTAALFGPNPASGTTVLGAGTAWMSRHESECSPPVAVSGAMVPGQCAEARRVDVMVRLVPREVSTTGQCVMADNDPAGTLACLQRCLETSAVNVRGNAAEQVLLTTACGAGTRLPEGWIRAPEPVAGPRCTTADLRVVRETLGM